MRPARAKALIINAFALAGRFVFINPHTQGVGLCAYWVFSPRCLSFDTPSIPLKDAVYRLHPLLYCLFFQSMLHPKEGGDEEEVCHTPGYWVA